MNEARVIEYQISNKILTRKLYEENEQVYNLVLLCIRAKELEKGAKVKKVGKPSSRGTIITFVLLENVSDCEREIEQIKELCQGYKKNKGE